LATTGDYLRLWKVMGDDDKTTVSADRDRDRGSDTSVSSTGIKTEVKEKEKEADSVKMKCLLNNVSHCRINIIHELGYHHSFCGPVMKNRIKIVSSVPH
jgi:hypothetical protein